MPETGNIWVDVFSNLGSFGIVCFVIWWTFTRTQPRFEATLKSAQDAYQKSLADQTDAHQKLVLEFLRELNEGRSLFAKALEEERAANSRDIDRLLEEMRRMNAVLVYLVGQIRGREVSLEERKLLGLVVQEQHKPG